jgi:hypothetical protein
MPDWSIPFRLRFDAGQEPRASTFVDNGFTNEAGHDPQAQIRRIPVVFPQGKPKDG